MRHSSSDSVIGPPVHLDPGGLRRTAHAAPGEKLLNPIAPCGACNEWLRKIAAPNPDFKVVMFVDTTCDLIYEKNIID